MLLDTLSDRLRESLAALPPQTRTAWKWDMATGVCAGIYQGCVWTFVLRVARADLHASGPQMGWIAAAPALGYLFATIWARQMDGRAKMPFVFWTWLLARGLFLLSPFVHTRAQFVALVVITPIIFSVSTPAYTAIMKEIYPDSLRGRLMSLVRVGMSLAMLVTALVTGRLMDHGLPWHFAFLFGGVFGALTAWTFHRIPITVHTEDDGLRLTTAQFLHDTLDILRRNPGYRWFIASVFLSGFGNLICATLMPIYQVDRFHVTNTDVANMQNIASVLTFMGYAFWGMFLDRKGPLQTLLVAVVINLLVPLLYAAASGMGALYLAAAATGLMASGIDLAYLNTILLFAEPGKAAQYQALHSSFFGIRGSLAPYVAIPLMLLVGFRAAFLISFSIILIGVWVQLISMRDYRRQIRAERLGLTEEGESVGMFAGAPLSESALSEQAAEE